MASTKVYADDKRTQKRAEKEILRKLAELGGKQYDDDDITYEGDRLVIPASMTIGAARRFLERKVAEMEKSTDFIRVFNYRPWDGAYCMWNALKRTFGAVMHKGTEGFFGENPPAMITINTDVNKQEQVPWGQFALPALPNTWFETFESDHPELGPLFAVSANGPKKYAAEIQGVFKVIEDELEENSMYRGKAFDGQVMPEFVDLSGVDPNAVVYSLDVQRQLEVNVWAQLRYTEKFENKVPLKRAVLIHGPYGSGKTLAAALTGQEATANGWTFIKGRPGRDNLGFVMQTARLYQPAVVFYEDVDQITDVNDMSGSSISRLLDDFDGIDAKGTRILCVLTTNHPERIHKAMGRPGRLDAMIEIKELDQEGVTKLVQVCVGNELDDTIDWDAVYAAAEGYMPAFVTEFAGRAWRYAMVRQGGDDDNITIVTEDLVESADGLRPQFTLMNAAKDRHERQPLEEALGTVVTKAVRENLDERVLVENGESH
jgi:transitional endoplasmic reticulum ATPase